MKSHAVAMRVSRPLALALALLVGSATVADAEFILGTATKLPEPVNSTHTDFSSSISADGLELYFTSTRPGGNFDTWVARRADVTEPFETTEFVGRGAHPDISADGLSLFVNDGGRFGQRDLFVYTRPTADADWEPRENLGENVNSADFDRLPSISHDALTLYFTRSSGQNAGTFELWTTSRIDPADPFAFGPAVYLDAPINDPGAWAPEISSDGLAFFFSSTPGRDGFGQSDLWVSTRPSINAPWRDPVNLGDAVNTSEVECCADISADGRTLYFSRAPDIAGNFDLWQVRIIGEVTPLQAGDAEQDLDFDQMDLVQVQTAAKYLTGRAATWGEGDWNGSPGGQRGIPPAGDGTFDQLDILKALAAGVYLTGPYAAVIPNGRQGDAQTSVGYDANTGEMWFDAAAGHELTSINIDSAAGIFSGEPAQNLGGSFDNDADNNIFKATFGGSFGSLSFGNVAQPGLSEGFVSGDLTVVGSLAGGGGLGDVDLIFVPEPSALCLFALGLVGTVCLLNGRR